LIEELERQRGVYVSSSYIKLLLSDFRENFGIVGQMLESIDETGRHGVLGGEEEAVVIRDQ